MWNGFETDEFEFEGFAASVVKPENKCGFAALKTEYRDAFPATEIMLLKNGFHIFYIQNKNRWGTSDDIERKARFIRFAAAKYGVSRRVVPVGMSCGGLFAIKLAAIHPELVSCLYLDAPVVNYLSCPCGFGSGNILSGKTGDYTEILAALELSSISQLLSYREAPIDYLARLADTRVPIAMVAGDSDKTVPYHENGALIEKIYKERTLELFTSIKPGCDHHPHGLDDPTPVVEFILAHI